MALIGAHLKHTGARDRRVPTRRLRAAAVEAYKIGYARGVQGPSIQGHPPELSLSPALADTGGIVGLGRF